MTVEAQDGDKVCRALHEEGISCAVIGQVTDDPEGVWDTSSGKHTRLPYPERDEIARFYEEHA